MLLLIYLGCAINQRSIPFASPPVAGSGASATPVFSGVFSFSNKDAKRPEDFRSGVSIAEEIGGVGDKGSGCNGQYRDTLGGPFEMSLRSASTAKVSGFP